MNTIHYVFQTRSPQLQKLVVKYGLPPAVNQQDLWRKTNFLIAKFREKFMKDIADIHPDRDLFAWRFSLETPKPSTKELENIANNTVQELTPLTMAKSNACGCSGADGEQTSGCCGSGANGEKTSGCNGDKECSCKKSNAEGTEAKTDIKQVAKDNMPLVIIGSLAVVIGLMALSKS